MPEVTFKDRVVTVLGNLHRSKSWLAERIGVSRQAFNYLLNYTSDGGKYTSMIAHALDINPEWLRTGEGEIRISTSKAHVIPLVDFKNMPLWLDHDNTDFYEPIATEYPETSKLFATILDNSSMEEAFPKGSILIFDRNAMPANGDYVLARLSKNHGEPSFVFRKFVHDGSGVYLKALDTTFRTIGSDEPFEIIATLVEQRRRFSR